MNKKNLNCIRTRILKIISKTSVPEDFSHATNTLKWLLKIYPQASDALRIASLGHDIDRAVKERKVRRVNYQNFNDFKKAHAKNSAKIMREIMVGYAAEKRFISRVCSLVEDHEFGGNREANILKHADALSYFENNLPLYFLRSSEEEVRERVLWGYARLPKRFQKIVKKIKYKNKKLAELMKQWL